MTKLANLALGPGICCSLPALAIQFAALESRAARYISTEFAPFCNIRAAFELEGTEWASELSQVKRDHRLV